MDFEKRLKMIDKNLKALPLHDISYLTYILEDILYNNETKANLYLSNYLNDLIFHHYDDPETNIFYNEYKNSKDLEYALDIAQKYLALYNFYAAYNICNSFILHLEKNHAFINDENTHYLVKAAAKKFIAYPKPPLFADDAAQIIVNQQLDMLYYIHGICLYMLNDNQRAQQSLAKAYLYDPADLDIVIMYIEILTLNNDIDHALWLIKAYLPLAYKPQYLCALLQLAGYCYIQHHDIVGATTCFFTSLSYAGKHKKQIKQKIDNINKQKMSKPNKRILLQQLNKLQLELPQAHNFQQLIKFALKKTDSNPYLSQNIFQQLNHLFPHHFDMQLQLIAKFIENHDPINLDLEDLDDSAFLDNQLLERLIFWALERPSQENNFKVFYALGKSQLYLLGTPASSAEDPEPLLAALEDGSREISLFTDEHDIDMIIACCDNIYTKQKINFLQVIQMFHNPSYNISQIAINPTLQNEIIIDEHSLTIIQDMIDEHDNHILS